MTTAGQGTDSYAELTKGWAAQQRAEDEKWHIPEGGLFVTHCGRRVDGAGRACPQVIAHSGPCGLPPDNEDDRCRRDCPDGECYCPIPGESPINPACGDLQSSMCDYGCGCCTVCVALRVARQLVAVGDHQYAEVSVDVELCTVPEVLRIREALPDAWFRKEDVEDWARDPSDPTGLHGGVHAPELSSDPDFLSSHLPLWASMEYRRVGSVEEEFAALVGPNIGEIWWSSLIWPDKPDCGIYGEANNARVSLLFNCRTQGLDERSDDHTVLVHVLRGNRDGSEKRHASWLAEQIGQPLIGPPQE